MVLSTHYKENGLMFRQGESLLNLVESLPDNPNHKLYLCKN